VWGATAAASKQGLSELIIADHNSGELLWAYNKDYVNYTFYKHPVNLAQPQLCLNILRIES